MSVRVVYEGKAVTHFLVGKNVTVRNSDNYPEIYACLACCNVACQHSREAEAFDKGRRPATQETI